MMKFLNFKLTVLILISNNCISQTTNCDNLLETLIPKSLREYKKVNKDAKGLKKGDFVFINLDDKNASHKEKWNNWFKYNEGWNIDNPSVLELVIGNGRWMKKRVEFINPFEISNLRLEVIYINKYSPRSFAFKDINDNIYGYLEHPKYKKSNFKNNDLKEELNSIKLYTEEFVVFDEIDLKKNSFNYYKLIELDLTTDSPKLIIQEYNSKINISKKEHLEIDCRNIQRIYNKDCYSKVWNDRKNQYNNYLKSNFTIKEIEFILKEGIFIGMSEKALYESIGRPTTTNLQKGKNYTFKQLIYGDGIYIYIKDSKIDSFQNFESLR